MINKLNYKFIIICLFGLISCSFSNPEASKADIIGVTIQMALENRHFSERRLNDTISANAFGEYLKQLDYDKSFLLQSDISKMSKYKTLIDDEISMGNHQLYKLGTSILHQRVQEIKDFTTEFLAKPINFTNIFVFETDNDKREYCTDQNELKSRWEKILTYAVINNYIDIIEDQAQESNKLPEKSEKLAINAEFEEKSRKKIANNFEQRFSYILKENEFDALSRYFNAVATVYDPHTGYMAPEIKEDFDIDMSGQLEGIGAQLSDKNGAITVERIIPGSASWRQGELEPKDIILAVAQADGEFTDISGMRLRDAVRLIRGKKGTKVILKVKKANKAVKNIHIIRDVVILEEMYVKSTIIRNNNINKDIGYIFIPKFYHDFMSKNGRNVYDDVKNALIALKSKDIQGIIVDLRNNSGGYLGDVVKISGLFIEKGPIVTVRDRGSKPMTHQDYDPSITYDGPLVIMNNVFSASASEILAAALQDYKRAVIVGGKHSYGKGTVQEIRNLDSMINQREFFSYRPLGHIKITIQKYYRINGGSTQYKGVISDIRLPDPLDSHEIGEQYVPYSLEWDTIQKSPYKEWTKQKISLENLQKHSLERVNNSEYFQTIKTLIKESEERDKKSQISLNIINMQRERHEIKQESDEILSKFKEINYLEIIDIDHKIEQKHSTVTNYLIAQKKEWFKDLQSDYYLDETVKIMNDLIIFNK